MNSSRERMLQSIRQAVIEGNRAGASPAAIPERGRIGYQGAGSAPLARFRTELTAAGGHLHVVSDTAGAISTILDLVRAHSVRRVLLGHGEIVDALAIDESLHTAEIEVVDVRTGRGDGKKWFSAELGISGVDHLIAETGSVVMASRPEGPRSVSLLPPVHIAVAERRQLLPDLFDLFAVVGERLEGLPSGLTIITGPSKTGDIELRLVTGVHGPGEVHVVLITEIDRSR